MTEGKNSKQQILKNKQITMTEIQNSKQWLALEGFGHAPRVEY
jgi:hypothetical protein